MALRTYSKIALALTLALSAAACGDDKDDAPPDNTNKPSFTEDATVDAEVETDDAGDAGATDPNFASKEEAEKNGWAEGCFKGKPKTNEELLNACAKGFRTFDTKNYPASWSPTALPNLP